MSQTWPDSARIQALPYRARRTGAVGFLLAAAAASLHGQTDPLNQPWRWVAFTVESGLPSTQILDLVESPTGMLWVSTEGGVAWYDQYRWHRVHDSDTKPPYRIAPGVWNGVLAVARGRLFRVSARGFSEIPLRELGGPAEVLAAVRFDGTDILLHSTTGLHLLGARDVRPFSSPPGLRAPWQWRIGRTRAGTVWVAGGGATYEWVDHQWTSLGTMASHLEGNLQGDLMLARQADIGWRPRTSEVRTITWDGLGQITAMDVGPAGQAIVADTRGRVRARRDGRWHLLAEVPPELVSPRFVRYDRLGDLWVGTDHGLFLHRSATHWQHWRLGETVLENQVNALLLTRAGDTWAGTNDGIAIRRADETLERVRSVNGTRLHTITGLAEDRDGGIWISSALEFDGAYRWYEGRWTHFDAAQGLDAPRVHRIVPDSRGRLWFLGLSAGAGASGPGAFRFDGERFERWNIATGLRNGRVYALAEGPDGALWFGTRGGISRWKRGTWTHWTTEDGLLHDKVFALAVSAEGEVWFSHQVAGLGLGYLDEHENPAYLSVKDGLVNSEVVDLQFGPDGTLWISTSGGLALRRDGAFVSFSHGRGLGNHRLWPVIPTADKVYVGTLGGGISVLNLAETSTPAPHVSVWLPSVDQRGTTFRWRADAYRGELPPEDIETRYRVDDQPWSLWSSAREATVIGLPPGKHIFAIQAKGLFGAVEQAGTAAAFRVAPPQYLHPLVLGIVALWLVSVAWLGTMHVQRRRAYIRVLEDSERRHRVLNEQYHAVLSAVPDHILHLSRDGRLLDHDSGNDPPLGRVADLPDVERFQDALPQAIAERCAAAIARAIDSGEEQEVQYELPRGDRTASYEARFVRSGPNDVVAIVRDVTRQRTVQERLRQAQKMEALGQLTGGMAHDFNNLLTIIRVNSDLIANALPSTEQDIQDDVREVRRAALRGAALIRKLMAFSRRERQPARPVDLSKLVTEMSSTLRRVLPESVDILVRNEPSLPIIEGDPGAIESMIMNLATNAGHAMRNDGRLVVETGRAFLDEQHGAEHGWGNPGDYVTLSVIDTGVGMDEKTRSRIFDPFFTTKGPGSGTGLGMAMVYGFMKQHHGFANVESEVGQGTTVTLYFPLRRVSEALPDFDLGDEQLRGGNETILLVEDEASIRSAAKRALEQYGYTVLLAADGDEALRVFRQSPNNIDLVISDVVMPKKSGPALYSAIQRERDGTKFIFTSGYTARDISDTMECSPAVPFLRKPWTVGELLGHVRGVLEHSEVVP